MKSEESEEKIKGENKASDKPKEGLVVRLISLLERGRHFALNGIWEIDDQVHKLPIKFLINLVRLGSVSFRGFVDN
ncbi:MAG: hypothetical protein O2857_30235, partial [Planctomycetota bacterium]|nr:hypothetical protein [Planctomycetota bacterium]